MPGSKSNLFSSSGKTQNTCQGRKAGERMRAPWQGEWGRIYFLRGEGEGKHQQTFSPGPSRFSPLVVSVPTAEQVSDAMAVVAGLAS